MAEVLSLEWRTLLWSFPRHQGDDYSSERHRVDREDRRGARQCHDDAADCRSDSPGGVTRDAAQSRGGRYLLARDGLGLNRLPGRSGQCRSAADGQCKHQQCCRADATEVCQHRQRQRHQHRVRLENDQQSPPVEQVGKRPGEQSQKQRRPKTCRLDQCNDDVTAVPFHQKPLGRHALHPRPDVGGQLRDEQVAVHATAHRCPYRRLLSVGALLLVQSHQRTTPFALRGVDV